MANETAPTKPSFVSELVKRTAATLPPEMQAAALSPGTDLHTILFATATMIELAQQTPGPTSEKAKAFQAARAAEEAAKAKP